MPWSIRMTLMASAASLIPFIYVFWRFGTSLTYFFSPSQREIKYILILLLIFIYGLPLIILFKYISGNIRQLFLFDQQLHLADYLFNFPFWLLLITVIELLPYMITIDLMALVAKFLLQQFNERIQYWGHLLRIVMVAGVLIFVIVRTLSDTYGIHTAEYDIGKAGNPGNLQQLTIALIADIQVDRYTQETKIKKVINAVNTDTPDMLFFAGDLVTRGTTYIDQGIKAMCDMTAHTARIACIGDHDIWADPNYITDKFKQCSWTVLQDAHTVITHNNRRIIITGITYAYSQRISTERLNQLLQSAPEGDLKILLVHQPAKMLLQAASQYGYDLFLAGHTHGGQIIFRPFGMTITPTQIENDIFAGHTMLDSLNVFISNGIGLTLMPLRYRASAEIVKIRISY